MASRRRLLLAAAALLPASRVAPAQQLVTEVVPAGFRSTEELLPILRPLIPPPGSIGGIGGQLVIRTTPANLAEIKEVLRTLDRPPANLLVSVRHTVDESVRRDLLQARGQLSRGDVSVSAGSAGAGRGGVVILGGDADANAALRVLQTERDRADSDVQSVRVLEGREAFIRSGKAVPLADRRVVVGAGGTLSVQEGVRYEDVDTGFYVRPRLAGDIVTVEVAPSRRQLSGAGGGRIDVQSASTVVSGPLGRWMEIGGVSGSGVQSRSGVGFSSSTRESSNRGIFIKVERLP